MRIAKILHDEMYRVARQIVSEKYNDPRAKDITQSLDDILRIEAAKDSIPKQFRQPEMIFDSAWPTQHQKMEADSFYLRTATLLEYNELKLKVDESVHYIFSVWKETKKLPLKYKGFWKYYIPMSKNVASKEEKKDCARYAFLRTLDENDQIITFGVIWKPDASIVSQYNSRLSGMTRDEKNAEKWRQEQFARNCNPSWEVQDGKVRSAYVLAFSGDES